MLICELGLLADAVYGDGPNKTRFGCIRKHGASGAFDGFQAAAYAGRGCIVVAFRGTSQKMDAIADLKLGSGMNTSYFSAGERFVEQFAGENVIVCGHSLGGAIAQVVANRKNIPMVTFNAPGVAVFASRNIAQASVAMTAIRTAGMLASAVRHPMQAARDARALFNEVKGLNVCLHNDVVSKIGVHYGEVLRIAGTSMNPLTEHRMTTMNTVLERHGCGARSISPGVLKA